MQLSWTALVVLAAGWWLARSGLRGRESSTGPGRLMAIGLAPVVGNGVAALLFVVCAALRTPRPGPIAFVAATILLSTALRFATSLERADDRDRGLKAREPSRISGLQSLLLAASVVLALGTFLLFSASWPVGGWDAVSHWSSRARLLDLDYPAAFDRWDRIDTKLSSGNPLILPGALAMQFGWTSADDESVARSTALGFLLGLCALTGAAVWRYAGARWACVAVAVTCSTPAVVYWSAQRGADLPLGTALLASALALATRIDGGPVSPALAGFLLSVSASIKKEGLLVSLLLLAIGAWIAARRSSFPKPRAILLFLAGLAPGLLELVWYRSAVPHSGTPTAFYFTNLEAIVDRSRWGLLARAFLEEIDPIRAGVGWGLGWIVVGVGWLLSVRRPLGSAAPGERFLGLASAGALVGYLVIFVVTPLPQEWHILQALNRFLLQVYPLLVVSSCLGLDRAGPLGGLGADER